MRTRIITESELQSFINYLQEEEKSKNTIEKYLRDGKLPQEKQSIWIMMIILKMV